MSRGTGDTARPDWRRFYLTTWYYVLDRNGVFHRITVDWADMLLSRGSSFEHPPVPSDWQYDRGAAALFGAVLIRHRQQALYVERGHLSLHTLGPERANKCVQATWPWQAFAQQLIEDCGASSLTNNKRELGGFLAVSSTRMLPDDVARLLHDTPDELHRIWLQVLTAGQHSRALWDLRTGALHPPSTPITS